MLAGNRTGMLAREKLTALSVAALAAMLLALLASPAAAQESAGIPEELAADTIRNYRRIDDRLAAAGQPTPETIRELKQLGFKTVVNLRAPGEVEEDEGALVREAGLRYVSVPISSGDFSSADVDAVARVLDDDAAAPVLLHCAASNRVGGVLAVIEARRGKSIEDALAFGRQAGLKSDSMIEAAKRVIKAER